MKAQDVLPDDVNQGEFQGVMVRKGTVGAFLANARAWCDAAATRERREAGRDIAQAARLARAGPVRGAAAARSGAAGLGRGALGG